MRPSLSAVILLILAAAAGAQDRMTIGSGVVASGGSVEIPIHVRDLGGTPLGGDTTEGIRGLAFKVRYPAELIASASFARASVAASATPLFERTMQDDGWLSYVASFVSPLPLTLNGAAPGNQVGTLTLTFHPAAASRVATLTLDSPGASLSNAGGTVVETVANGELAPVDGTVTVSGALAAPGGLLATANGTSEVALSWSGSGGADHYEIWRSANSSGFSPIGTSPVTSFADTSVAANASYLYRVLAVDAGGGVSPFSNRDVATTIAFADDPLAAKVTQVKLVHLTQLRTAIGALRALANLPPLAADPTISAGQPVRAAHANTLRTGLAQARAALALPALTFTDSVTARATPIKAVHLNELRNGVR
ncbi:MAG: hypothetical protein QOJ98_3049 [Acidobacteriota bacterium]|jgi:hypothetical protein|nr:hypothetical protein [Acidobacteriota bacterium]